MVRSTAMTLEIVSKPSLLEWKEVREVFVYLLRSPRMTPHEPPWYTQLPPLPRMNANERKWTRMDANELNWTRLNANGYIFLFDFSAFERQRNTFCKIFNFQPKKKYWKIFQIFFDFFFIWKKNFLRKCSFHAKTSRNRIKNSNASICVHPR